MFAARTPEGPTRHGAATKVSSIIVNVAFSNNTNDEVVVDNDNNNKGTDGFEATTTGSKQANQDIAYRG